ncbi:MAG: prepilin-type N-terminal cleavage/methylation domain-containing protein [Candidatus Stahlbacteria bacterium]|nr:prepilin-type N-terminal cleavage/methylation domain-containing protein [Candidatus Stahlbacteria bacterium]
MNKGLTIIELLVTVIISSIIIGSAVALHIVNQRIFAKEEALIDVRNNVRGALDIMITDIRVAGYNPTQAPAPSFDPPIRYGCRYWVFIRADTNGDGACEQGEGWAFHASNNAIFKYNSMNLGISDSSIIAENIDHLEFRYFDADGNELATPVAPALLETIRTFRILIVGKTTREFSGHQETGTYPDATPYNDRCYRCWDSTFVRLRNI